MKKTSQEKSFDIEKIKKRTMTEEEFEATAQFFIGLFQRVEQQRRERMIAKINNIFVTSQGEELYDDAIRKIGKLVKTDMVITLTNRLIRQCGPVSVAHTAETGEMAFNYLIDFAYDMIKMTIDYDVFDKYEYETIYFISKAMLKSATGVGIEEEYTAVRNVPLPKAPLTRDTVYVGDV